MMSGGTNNNQILGVLTETTEDNGIYITKIHVQDEQGEQTVGKTKGHYIKIELPELRNQDTELQDRVATKLAQEFEEFLSVLGIVKTSKVLVIGLGNWNVTPDALGPIVVENIMVTRHYFELVPEQADPRYRQVSAVSPGVLGITGI